MKTLTFVAGLAAGYVLGTRAGHEKYEQIVDGAKNMSARPSVKRAREKIRGAVGEAKDAADLKLG